MKHLSVNNASCVAYQNQSLTNHHRHLDRVPLQGRKTHEYSAIQCICYPQKGFLPVAFLLRAGAGLAAGFFSVA